MSLDTIPLRSASTDLQAVIETPRRSRVKYSFDKASGLFLAKKVLALGFAFPFPFGVLPSTKAADGNPLDVLVLTQLELVTGTLIHIRLLGVIQAEQQEAGTTVRNDRLLAGPVIEGGEEFSDLDDVGEARLHQIENFLAGYRAAEGAN
jgi:inorganic pyrophosphatase